MFSDRNKFFRYEINFSVFGPTLLYFCYKFVFIDRFDSGVLI